ncbi:hypothetical protein [Streptomyces sp. NPDC005805]|uniref:hypothetical protein n=1 Tax=Streptomyces sp. NPDC005805 TaxID=3157068 RepID=UPI0033ED76DE
MSNESIAPIRLETTRTETYVSVGQKIPVSLHPGGPLDHKVFVKLSLPLGVPASGAVQVLSGPMMWNHRYWDFEGPEGSGDRYNWTAHAAVRGHATVAIDRIGIGRSSHPASELVDASSNAHVNYQVVMAAREGRLLGPDGPVTFRKTVVVSHSFSTAVTEKLLTAHPDVCDLAVMSGFTHKPRLDNFATRVLANLEDGEERPQGYRTTIPLTRHIMFYWPAPIDGPVLAYDEAVCKSTLTTAEWDSLAAFLEEKVDVRVPLLFALGQHDAMFAASGAPKGPYGSETSSVAALLAEEQPNLGDDIPELTGFILPGGGHNLNQMPNAVSWFDFAQDWITERL